MSSSPSAFRITASVLLNECVTARFLVTKKKSKILDAIKKLKLDSVLSMLAAK
jgi:hypothetical protein